MRMFLHYYRILHARVCPERFESVEFLFVNIYVINPPARSAGGHNRMKYEKEIKRNGTESRRAVIGPPTSGRKGQSNARTGLCCFQIVTNVCDHNKGRVRCSGHGLLRRSFADYQAGSLSRYDLHQTAEKTMTLYCFAMIMAAAGAVSGAAATLLFTKYKDILRDEDED